MIKMSLRGPSLKRRLLFHFAAAIALQTTLMLLVIHFQLDYRIWLPLTALLTLMLVGLAIRWFLAPIGEVMSALETGVSAMRDDDFSVTIYNKRFDELDTIVQLYNDLCEVLRDERSALMQREALLDKIVQSTPVAIILTNEPGQIVYSNVAARTLLQEPRLQGQDLAAVIRDIPEAMRLAALERRDGLFTDTLRGETVSYSLNCQSFLLQNQTHYLYLFKNLTTEISRNEIALWKRVIRLISHELNNSLAPISSMTASAKTIIARQENLELLPDMLDTVERRARRLYEFTHQYANFARLPAAKLASVDISEFLDDIARICAVPVLRDFDTSSLRMDSAQIEQVLINIVKNAKESGSTLEHVKLSVHERDAEFVFAVTDRGDGMSGDQITQAMLPFFTTKKEGTGIGLPLCHEIITGHGGRLKIANRDGGGVRVSFALPKHAKDSV